MPLYLTIACLLLSYMYECSLVNLLMEEIKIKNEEEEGRCSASSSAKQEKSGSIYNLVKN